MTHNPSVIIKIYRDASEDYKSESFAVPCTYFFIFCLIQAFVPLKKNEKKVCSDTSE